MNLQVHNEPAFKDISDTFKEILQETKNISGEILQTAPAMFHNMQVVEHLCRNNIPGKFVECGIYRAGTPIMMIKTIQKLGLEPRDIWLYDTFDEGFKGTPHEHPSFEIPLDETKSRLNGLNYPYIHYIKGKVQDTLPILENRPSQIAFLRLDTDYYDSTKAELQWLEPLVVPGGIIVIDDYGAYGECAKAVDEYIQGKIFMHRIDEHVRSWVK